MRKKIVSRLLGAVCLVLASPGAFAQSVPQLPPPLSLSRLHLLIQAAGDPTEVEWGAIDDAHAQYLQQFAAEAPSRQRLEVECDCSGGLSPALVHSAIARVHSLATLDGQLFAAIENVLGAKFAVGLSEARRRRSIERLVPTFPSWTLLGPPLWEKVRDALRAPEDRAAVEAALQALETQAEPLLQTIVDKTMKARLDGAIAASTTPLDRNNSESMAEYWAAFHAGAAAAEADVAKAKAQLHSIETKSLADVIDRLPFLAERRVKFAVNGPQGTDYSALIAESAFTISLQHPSLSNHAKEEVLSQYEAWALADDVQVARIRANSSAELLASVRDERAALAARAEKALSVVSTSEALGKWTEAINGIRLDRFSPFDAPLFARSEAAVTSPGWQYPRALSNAEIVRRAGKAATGLQAAAAYGEQWVSNVEPLIRLAKDAYELSMEATDFDVAVTNRRIAAFVAKYIAAIDAARSVDRALVDTLMAEQGMAIDRGDLILLLLLRDALAFDVGNWEAFSPPELQSRSFSITAATAEGVLSEAGCAQLRDALEAQRDALVEAWKERAVTQLRTYCMRSIASRTVIDQMKQEATLDDIDWSDIAALTQTACARLLACDRRVRAALDNCLAVLDDSDTAIADFAFEREASRGFFDGPSAPWGLFDAAAALTDLTDEQRRQVAAARYEILRKWSKLARRLGDGRRRDRFGSNWCHLLAERRLEESEIEFWRDELATEAVSELRSLLTRGQRAELPGLDDYDRLVNLRLVWRSPMAGKRSHTF